MKNIKNLPLHKQINSRLIAPDTWFIDCYNVNQAHAHPYVLCGREKTLVIDPCDSEFDLRRYIEEFISDKPIEVLCTNGKPEHVAANWRFEDCPIYMSGLAWNEIQIARATLPKSRLRELSKGDYDPVILEVGDTIDLGGRVIEMIPFIGITTFGALLAFDKNEHILFTGDEIDCCQVLVSGKRDDMACVELMRDNLSNLIDKMGNDVVLLCPSHNGSPIHRNFLYSLLENCNMILNGAEGESDVGSSSFIYNPFETRSEARIEAILSDPKMKRHSWKGSSIVYRTDRVFKNQVSRGK